MATRNELFEQTHHGAALGLHLGQRLAELGVRDVFSVLGDSNLSFLEHVTAKLNLVGCGNELDAGYAAGAYARAKGVGVCVLNGGSRVVDAMARAYSDNLSVIYIDSGSYDTLHHMFKFLCFQKVTCAQVIVNHLDDAHELIDHTISKALIEKKPVYISIRCNLAAIPCPAWFGRMLEETYFDFGVVTDPDAVAREFVDHYYNTFDSNRANLAALYQDDSMLTFEGQKIQGIQRITAMLTSSFQQCKHSIITIDCQPSAPPGGMLIYVNGYLQLPCNQFKFSQMFHLMPTPAGSYYVFNDIFRLNYM